MIPRASPSQRWRGGHAWQARGAWAYNGGLRAESPWSRGRAPSQEVRPCKSGMDMSTLVHPSSPRDDARARVYTPKRHLDQFSRFCRLAVVTNRHTHTRTHRNICITTGRVHLAHVWCGAAYKLTAEWRQFVVSKWTVLHSVTHPLSVNTPTVPTTVLVTLTRYTVSTTTSIRRSTTQNSSIDNPVTRNAWNSLAWGPARQNSVAH